MATFIHMNPKLAVNQARGQLLDTQKWLWATYYSLGKPLESVIVASSVEASAQC